MNAEKPTVGVSACLLGERVRYDGGHKHVPLVAAELSGALRLIPVCPEVEIGLGAPRPPIRLVRDGRAIRLRAVEGGADLTDCMAAFARARLEAFEALGICGFVLKARSPSCGLLTVPVHDEEGREVGTASGLFARRIEASRPDLPIVDEEALETPEGRGRFIAAVTDFDRRRVASEGRTA